MRKLLILCYIFERINILFNTICQIESNYDIAEATKCLQWIQIMTGVEEIAENAEQIDASHDKFQSLLGDGMILLKWALDSWNFFINF